MLDVFAMLVIVVHLVNYKNVHLVLIRFKVMEMKQVVIVLEEENVIMKEVYVFVLKVSLVTDANINMSSSNNHSPLKKSNSE
jgi:hypothetical protein